MLIYDPPILSVPLPTLVQYLTEHFSLLHPPQSLPSLMGVLSTIPEKMSYGESCSILAEHIYRLYLRVEKFPSPVFFTSLAEELVGNYFDTVMGVLNEIPTGETGVELIDTPEDIIGVINDVSYLMLKGSQ
jgi:hypothetical protein